MAVETQHRRGLFGAPLIPPPDSTGIAPKTPPQVFKPNTGQMIAGVIGDSISQWAGGQARFLPALYQQRQAVAEAQRLAAAEANRRIADRDEWAWREQWKQQHASDQFTQYMQAAGIDPRSPQGQALYRQRAESMATPPMMAVDGFDAQGNPTKTFMPRAGIGPMSGQGTPSGPAPGTVRNGYRFTGGNPNDRNSWVPVGGAPSAGGVTFR